MKLFYELVGRVTVARFLARRRPQLRAAAVAVIAAAALAAYLAAGKDVDEG